MLRDYKILILNTCLWENTKCVHQLKSIYFVSHTYLTNKYFNLLQNKFISRSIDTRSHLKDVMIIVRGLMCEETMTKNTGLNSIISWVVDLNDRKSTVASRWHSNKNCQFFLRNFIFMELIIKTAELSIKTAELSIKTAELILIPRNKH